MLKQNVLMKKTLCFKPDTPVFSLSSRRIVLLGQTGVGKSAAGNTILGQKVFRSEMRMGSVTSECSAAQAAVSGRSVSVVDTPGLFDTKMKHEELMTEIARSVYLSSPGPHAFLIVFPVNMRITEHKQQIPQMIEMMFGEEVLKYSILLFTHGDLLKGASVEELIEHNSRLRRLVDQCGGRFHVFNNRDQNNREQVNDLLQKIDSMIEQNGGGHYSHQMFEDAHRYRREEEEMRQREEEERKQQEKQRQEEIERIRAEIEDKYKHELERLTAERQREEEEETFFTRFKRHCLVAGAAAGAAVGAVVAAPVGVAAVVVAGTVGGVSVGEVLGEAFAAQRRERNCRRENDRSFRK